MKLVRTNAIIPLSNSGDADFSDKTGFPFWIESPSNSAHLCEAATDFPAGVIVEGRPSGEKSSAAIAGGIAGTVRVKILQDVTDYGNWLQLVQVGADVAYGPDAGTGTRRVVGIALEPGVAGELIEAVIWPAQAGS